jgi:hypothetical protein
VNECKPLPATTFSMMLLFFCTWFTSDWKSLMALLHVSTNAAQGQINIMIPTSWEHD